MNREALFAAQLREELGLGQARLLEHLMKEWGGDVARHLMTQTDDQDLAGRESFLPGLVFRGADEAKAA